MSGARATVKLWPVGSGPLYPLSVSIRGYEVTAEVWAESFGLKVPYPLILGDERTAEVWAMFSLSRHLYPLV